MDRWQTRLIEAAGRERELRPKNHGVAVITAWPELLAAVQRSTTLEVLYLQSQPALDDAALDRLGAALAANPRITGVNLGELVAVTAEGWRRFAEALPATAVRDCYAQPAGGGPPPPVARAIKDAILANRARLGRGRPCPSMWRASDYR